jgi:hypothetical protein
MGTKSETSYYTPTDSPNTDRVVDTFCEINIVLVKNHFCVLCGDEYIIMGSLVEFSGSGFNFRIDGRVT